MRIEQASNYCRSMLGTVLDVYALTNMGRGADVDEGKQYYKVAKKHTERLEIELKSLKDELDRLTI